MSDGGEYEQASCFKLAAADVTKMLENVASLLNELKEITESIHWYVKLM